jgi:hypothetical protein
MRFQRRLSPFLILTALILAVVFTGLVLPALFTDALVEVGQITSPRLAPGSPTPFQPFPVAQLPVHQAGDSNPTACTYHFYYWLDRPGDWPSEVLLGSLPYSRQHIQEIFRTEPDHPRSRLIFQMAAASLNILHGADFEIIQTILLDANSWLASNPPGASISEFNAQRGEDLATLLEGYNLGLYGPGACLDIPPTPDLTASAVPTATSTTTETPLPEPTQTPIPQPTQVPSQPKPTDPPPPPPAPPSPPTATSLPPSPTPPPPTEAPPPTLPPPPTAVLPPLPTPTLAPVEPPPPPVPLVTSVP